MTAPEAAIGRSRRQECVLSAWPAQALHATLDLGTPSPADELPPLWHWLYFLETAPRSRLGHDGHPATGDFLPTVPQPRRMFAGAATRFLEPLRLNRSATLTETVRNVQSKQGRQGAMTIVTVAFDYDQDGRRCIEEERSYVYLPETPVAAQTAAPPESPDGGPVADAPWSTDLAADEVLLFRFSALTFNSHRIHFDQPYASTHEGYPQLVVQAPLTAILLAEMMRQHTATPCAALSFRAVAPLFAGAALRLRGTPSDDGATLTAYRTDGTAALCATATFR